MTPEQFSKVVSFEDGLKVGDDCVIRWVHNRIHFCEPGKVRKKNKKSIIVTLNKTPSYYGGPEIKYYDIHAPLISNIEKWKASNRVEPIGGYE